MKNGNYTIEKIEITNQEGEPFYGIALGYNAITNIWVTWAFKKETGEESAIDFFWGHYFEREADALIDYCRRIIDQLK